MRTIEQNIYLFSELSETAKAKALADFSDINVDFNWWSDTYEDAENIGLKLEGFDLYRYTISGKLIRPAETVASLIIKEHGEMCGTYQVAKSYLNRIKALMPDDKEDADDDLKESLLSEYLTMLKNECEYLESAEAVTEAIEANEYEFYSNGVQFTNN